jgi:hypothetical protein
MRNCKSCEAYCPDGPGARSGSCRRRAPMPVMVGVQQQQIPGSGLMTGRMNGATIAQPVVQGFFAPVGDACWCMEWRPAQVDAAQAADAAVAEVA